jgi:hypothetical protein
MTTTISTEARPNILCLGVSYADVEAEIEKHGYDRSIINNCMNAETVIRCVQEKILNQMDGRDLARILATEQICQANLYCVSQEKGAIYKQDRHLDANFNRPSFVKLLQDTFTTVQYFDQIILDYFWIPTGWDVHHWNMKFFETTLLSFAKANVIQPISHMFHASFRRGIYLPFCFHCFQAIVTFSTKLTKYYNISFLRKNELHCITLWTGTQQINKMQMQHILGKRIDQEEVYCTFNARHIQEMGSGGSNSASKHELIALASCLEDFPDIRFILLEPLHTSDPSDPQYICGKFLGLVPPLSVQRGFRYDDKVSSQSPHRSMQYPNPPSSTSSSSLIATRKRHASLSKDNGYVNNPKKSTRYNLRNQSPKTVVMQPSALPSSSMRKQGTTMLPKELFPDG